MRRTLMIPILIGGGIKSHRLCEVVSLADQLPGWLTYIMVLLQEAASSNLVNAAMRFEGPTLSGFFLVVKFHNPLCLFES